jgi:hypothetical protein
LALGIEMYYSGWVFRGYFESMSVTESAERIGMFDYDIAFTVTQRRGYRTNFMPWHQSAIDGPSDWKTIPHSFSDLLPSDVNANGRATTNVAGIPVSR